MKNVRFWISRCLVLACAAIIAGCGTATTQPPATVAAPTVAPSPSQTAAPLPTAPPSQTAAPTDTLAARPGQTPVEGQVVNPASVPPQLVEQARADLSRRLGLPAASFEVRRASAVEWPDSSLGCPKPGFMYSQIVTPGYLIVLTTNNREYEYHSDASRVILCE